MNNKLANKIFKKLNESFNDKQISNQNKAIIASILSLMIDNKTEEESDEMLAKYLINLKEFFQNQDIEALLSSMKENELGMFLSFIACGTAAIEQHQQATKDFVVEQINGSLKTELKDLANEQDLLAIESQINEELSNVITEYRSSKKASYFKILQIFTSYLNNKNKIAAQIAEVAKEIAESRLPLKQKKFIFNTTTITTIVAGLIGLAAVMAGGISLAELIIPLSTSVVTSLVVNKSLTQNALKEFAPQKKIQDPSDKKKITEKFKELAKELAQEQENSKTNTKENNKNLDQVFKGENTEFSKIKETLKGVMSNECNLTIQSFSTKTQNNTPDKPGKNSPSIKK